VICEAAATASFTSTIYDDEEGGGGGGGGGGESEEDESWLKQGAFEGRRRCKSAPRSPKVREPDKDCILHNDVPGAAVIAIAKVSIKRIRDAAASSGVTAE
jgi:hypothetical protein